MAEDVFPPKLYVEGKDDKFSIGSLLDLHGIRRPPKGMAVDIEEKGTDDKVLRAIKTELNQKRQQVIGFVLDSDESIRGRWDAVKSRLSAGGMNDVPDAPPEKGYVGVTAELGSVSGSCPIISVPGNSRTSCAA